MKRRNLTEKEILEALRAPLSFSSSSSSSSSSDLYESSDSETLIANSDLSQNSIYDVTTHEDTPAVADEIDVPPVADPNKHVIWGMANDGTWPVTWPMAK